MFIKSNFKIYFAFIIAFAFIVRLLLINAGLANSLSLLQNSKSPYSKSVDYSKMKNNSSNVTVTNPSIKYQVTEMCEEELDAEDELYKANAPAVLVIFYSLCTVVPVFIEKAVPFDYIKCEFQPKRYLSLSVFRI